MTANYIKGEEEMSFKIKATTPCYKFINASPEAQLAKIREEVEEVAQAWADYYADKTGANLEKLLVELLDVKACVNTAMAQINKDNDNENRKRAAKIKEGKCIPLLHFEYHKSRAKSIVVEKNLRRGYYVLDEREVDHE